MTSLILVLKINGKTHTRTFHFALSYCTDNFSSNQLFSTSVFTFYLWYLRASCEKAAERPFTKRHLTKSKRINIFPCTVFIYFLHSSWQFHFNVIHSQEDFQIIPNPGNPLCLLKGFRRCLTSDEESSNVATRFAQSFSILSLLLVAVWSRFICVANQIFQYSVQLFDGEILSRKMLTN